MKKQVTIVVGINREGEVVTGSTNDVYDTAEAVVAAMCNGSYDVEPPLNIYQFSAELEIPTLPEPKQLTLVAEKCE